MKYKNRVELTGNLGADPIERSLPSGRKVVSFSVATTQSWKSKGEWQERTDWHLVEAFGRTAEDAMFLKKGMAVDVEGQMRTDKFPDKNTGETRYITKVHATSVMEVVRRVRERSDTDHNASDVHDIQIGNSGIDESGHEEWLAGFDNAASA